MLVAVAVNRYHTSCEEVVPQDGVFPLGIAPLNDPEMLLQVLLGVNSMAFAHKLFTGTGYL